MLRVALCQINTVVGDLAANVASIRSSYRRAVEADADVAVFPEMTLTGYPPEDLLLKPGFVEANLEVLGDLASETQRCVAVIGFADGGDGSVANAAAVCANGRVVATYHKRELPNYDVFDEHRYFLPGDDALALYDIAGVRVGVTICEDLWIAGGPVPQLAAGGAQIILNINGSPYRRNKIGDRERVLTDRVSEGGRPIVYVNLVGGQDELVFDGGSMVVDGSGDVTHRLPQFVEAFDVVDLDLDEVETIQEYPVVPVSARSEHRPPVEPVSAALLDPLPEIYEALVLATRDYVVKNGFGDVCIGLSGGIDSSLVAALAVGALGPERVHGVLMPSRFSSDHSVTDAEKLAANLGIEHRIIAIEPAHSAFLDMLAPSFSGRDADVTEENLQSRIRGVTLMALANKFGWLVLTTGNKSEAAVGYSTLYGDTAGAYAVIKDLYKLTVYDLCRHVNERHGAEVIPEAVISKPPSAELRPDQRDDQSLPPYEQLDPLLEAYIEGDATAAELIADGFDADTVRRITRLVDISEYKRRQTPLGPRVSGKAFGRDRRLPITNRFR